MNIDINIDIDIDMNRWLDGQMDMGSFGIWNLEFERCVWKI